MHWERGSEDPRETCGQGAAIRWFGLPQLEHILSQPAITTTSYYPLAARQ